MFWKSLLKLKHELDSNKNKRLCFIMDYKKEISNYLDEVLERKEFSIDIIRKEIKNSKYVCVFGIGAISFPIISSIKNFTDIQIDFLSDNDQTKWGRIYHNDLKSYLFLDTKRNIQNIYPFPKRDRNVTLVA